jgi:hypothetical protein
MDDLDRDLSESAVDELTSARDDRVQSVVHWTRHESHM